MHRYLLSGYCCGISILQGRDYKREKDLMVLNERYEESGPEDRSAGCIN